MNNLNFSKWPKIPRFLNTKMVITQKMNGTNAQILFEETTNIIQTKNKIDMSVGRRRGWLSTKEDNFGFHAWASTHKHSLFAVLGRGRHYGEWCGPGIQNGEGLKERKFFSFDPFLEVPKEYKHLIEPVPLLYEGPINISQIKSCLQHLEIFGSVIDKFKEFGHFRQPEGIIINIGGKRFKMYLNG